MKTKLLTTLSIIISLIFSASSRTPISGDIGGMTLEAFKSPYIIEKDIIISSGEETIIKAGVALVFKSFTGLTIFGSLFVEGSAEEPVSFTSINDGAHNDASETLPKAFDWNGILIEKDAEEVKMRNFQVFYSVFGIKSKKQDIVLVNGLFRENGQFNFTINDEIMMVEEKISYSYNVQPARKELKNKERPKWKIPVQIGLGTIAAAGLGFAIAGKINSDKYQDKYIEQGSTGDALQYKDKRDDYIVMKNAGIICAITGSVGLTVTFLIKK